MQQLLTILGVVIGAAAAFTATALTERSKWRRTLDTRWDDKRLAAYLEFTSSLKATQDITSRLAATAGLPTVAPPIPRTAGLDALAAAESERTLRWEAVLLLGSPEAIAAGRRWHKEILRLGTVVLADDPDHSEFLRLFRSAGRLRDQFYEHARLDLGVRGGALPPDDGVWLPNGYELPADGEARAGSAAPDATAAVPSE